ncbi:beta-glucosidase family protein [Lachnoclostridium sp.]|uniref:beta-glucosidase family protein n=1 Tax=Lachnoclostridium sp. TaxID=2028282 RepID=UPI0028A27F8F|nr:glycoside hydrolase family 3 N-terminal domain-containing protein [Lachnoclostridium sp.]
MEMYLDKTLTARERAQDLLSKLTLPEKVNQLSTHMIPAPIPGIEEGFSLENGIGQLAIMGGKEEPKAHAAMIRKLQDKVMASSRLRIPAVIHCEALSGPVFPNALTYPTSISLGASFDPEMVREMGDKIRRQMVAVGARQALSPVLDIARDLRWGRINETYGNDPTLVSEMACAFISGLQGSDHTKGVAATAKHFLGYSITEGGINMAKTMLDGRETREVHAKPFEAAIRKADLLSVMNSYAEMEGRPVCASKAILNDLLREDLGFDGLVVSDYMSVDRLVNNFHVAKDLQDAAIQCLKAGLDVECPNPSAYNHNLVEAVEKGLLDEKYVDRSCLRSLELKFKLGLFENPYPQEDSVIEKVYTDESLELGSLEASRKAMTLTKNDGILPIKDKNARILVVGPTGNSLRKMWSTYTAVGMEEMLLGNMAAMAGLEGGSGQMDADSIFGGKVDNDVVETLIRRRYPQARTIFHALNEKYPNVEYLMGCDYKDPDKTYIEAAVEAAKRADIVIVTVGGKNGYGGHSTNGEGVDTASAGLPGAQEELLQKVGEANPNFVVVHTDAKPLVSSNAYENAKAVLEGWLCCTYAGQAIAETLSGENNPGGRLQQDVPYGDGVYTYHYQQNASHYKTLQSLGSATYNDQKGVVARPFGYGLSYTDFEYSNAKMNVLEEAIPVLQICVDVKNTGNTHGDEVVQLYGKDVIGSMIRPIRELLGFKRISLLPGEVKTVTFDFKLDILSFINEEKEWICEAGEYNFFLAKDSEDESLCLKYELPKTLQVDYTKRDFFAKAE